MRNNLFGFNLLFISVFILFISACEKKKPPTIPEELGEAIVLNEWVVAKPAALVSTSASIELQFKENLSPSHLSGQYLDKNPFSFEPKLSGRTQWVNSSVLRFIPDTLLPAGTVIQGVFHGKWALGEHRKIDDFAFSFKVAEQEALELDGDFVPDGNVGKTRYEGVISFAQNVDPKTVEHDLKLTGPSGLIQFTAERADANNRVRIFTEGLSRVTAGRTIRCQLPEPYGVGKTWFRELFLPGKENFRLLSHEELSDPNAGEALYQFRFSEELRANMDLSGFVKVKPELPIRILVRGKNLILKGDFEAGKNYHATIEAGLPSAFASKVESDVEISMLFKNQNPTALWLSDGIFLPSDNKNKLQFKTMNAKRVRVEIKSIRFANMGFFLQSNALEKSNASLNDESYESSRFQDVERVGQVVFRKTLTLDAKRNHWLKSELDLSAFFQSQEAGAYLISLQLNPSDLVGFCRNSSDEMESGDLYFEDASWYQNPCKEGGYWYQHGQTEKLVITTDVALTAKSTETGIQIYAVDVKTAKPISNLKLELMGYQHELLSTQETNSVGKIQLPSFGEFESNRKRPNDSGEASRPFYVKGIYQGRPLFLKLDKSPWEVSNFEVEGAEKGKSGLDAFIYTDRGVHRPGDTIHLSIILRQGRGAMPAGQPVTLRLKNPMGYAVLERQEHLGETGHLSFSLPTKFTDPTGNWSAEILLAGQSFYKNLKVETVKPNRLKVEVKTPLTLISDGKKIVEVKASVFAKWLFGTPAADLSFKARIVLEDAPRNFQMWPQFVFRHPNRKFGSHEEEKENLKLDDAGQGTVHFDLPTLASAPGPLEGKLRVAVEEKGGGFTARTDRFAVEPFPAYVGIKNPFLSGYARRGEEMKLQLLAINSAGKSIPGRKLRLRVYQNRHHWWWHYDSHERKDFRNEPKTTLIEEIPFQSSEGPTFVSLKLDEDGEHLIEVRDEAGHESGFFLWVSEWGSAPLADKKNRDYVALTFDRNVYHPDEAGKVTFKSPGEGRALVTVEQGESVLWSKWADVLAGETSVEFPIHENMVPNAYVSVSLIQPHAQAKNDLPMRVYGIKPIYIEDAKARLSLTLDVPKEIRPNSDFKLTLKSSSKEDATVTLAVVDEGLLDLTDFATPDPIKHFLRKIRLGVRTVDNFDDFMGALLPDMDRLFRIGGDDMELQRKRVGNEKGRRFLPVSLFKGPLILKAGASTTVTFHMPHYVGSVRVMAVASGQRGTISQEATILVKAPLMVLATLPRFASPGDRFDVPISLFRMDTSIKKIRVSVVSDSPLKIQGPSTQNIDFNSSTEMDVKFSAKVLATLGTAKVRIKAETIEGPYSVTTELVELPIRSPNPYSTSVSDFTLNLGSSKELVFKSLGMEGTNTASIEFTRMPDLQANSRFRGLIRYPYGCLEQMVSAAFPQLYAAQIVDYSAKQKQELTDNIHLALRRLPEFLIPNGGFSLWPVSNENNTSEDLWAGLFASHFLLEAKALGYNVSGSLLDTWIRHVVSQAKKDRSKEYRIQAYRLFLLAKAEKPQIGAMNLLRENHIRELDPLSKKLLAAAYALSGKAQEGSALDSKVITELSPYREMNRTYGSDIRDQALMSYLDIQLGNISSAGERLALVIKQFQKVQGFTTQELSFALLALGVYSQKAPLNPGIIRFKLTIDGKAKSFTLDRGRLHVPMASTFGKQVTLEIEQGGPLYGSLQIEGIPLDNPIRNSSEGLTLQRGFYTATGKTIALDQLKQNGDYVVVYRVENHSGENLNQVALSSLFPAGWEIENPRVGDQIQSEWIQKLSPIAGHYVDIRDDRINWFFDIATGKSLTLVAKVHLSFSGEWALPPIIAEAMYRPEIRASISGGRVFVNP